MFIEYSQREHCFIETTTDSIKKYKSALRKLVERKTSVKKKKDILQTGGFLSALLTPLLGVLGGLLGVNK